MAGRSRRSTGFEAWLNAATTPVYVLDRRRTVTIFNSGCEQLTGWTADEVVGERCDYTSPDDNADLERLLASLCPPPSVFEGQACASAQFVARRRQPAATRMLHHFPLRNRDEVIDRVLTIVLPVPEPPGPPPASPTQRLHAELASLRIALRQRFGFSCMVAVADTMQRVAAQVRLAANCSESVHLTGQRGSGRSHLARIIHNESELRPRSFVPLDCEALSAVEMTRIVRRLFDKQPGSAPALPHLLAGTLYLKSLEHLGRDVQQILVENWNPAEPAFPQRLISSSIRSLDELANDEAILPELLRLTGTLPVDLPPLHERIEDIPLLAQLFLEQTNAGRQHQIEGLAPETISALTHYNWPGNVAELDKVVTEAAAACSGTSIAPGDLPFRFRTGMDAMRTSPRPELLETELEPLLARVEREHIMAVLDACDGNRSEAARLLGITRPRLYRRLEQLGLTDR